MSPADPAAQSTPNASEVPLDAVVVSARPTSPRGYSLSALFLLVTTAGVVSALARGAWDTKTESWILAIHAAGGLVLGGILGLCTGLNYPRGFAAAMIGMTVGAIIGSICATVAAAGTNGWLFVFGSAGIIALGFLARRGSKHT
jgi:hypothetical protein